jgi:hypothetical protein
MVAVVRAAVVRRRMKLRRQGAEALAIRICHELSKLNAGRVHEAHAIQARLGINSTAAEEAYRYGASMLWLRAEGDPTSSLQLLEAGRKMIAES